MKNKTYMTIIAVLTLAASLSWVRSSLVTLPQVLETTYFYVAAILASSAIVFYLERSRFRSGDYIGGAVAGFLAASLAVYIAKAGVGSSFELQATIASIVLWVLAYTLLAGGAWGARSLAFPLILLALAIPLPSGFIDALSLKLAAWTARAASILTGAVLESTSYGLALVTHTPTGANAVLYVSRACSGIYGLTAVLSITPLVIYMGLRSRLGAARRVVAVLAPLAVAAGIVIALNVARVALAVKAVEKYGLSYSFKLLHHTPPLLYTAAAGVACVILALKIAGKPEPGGGGAGFVSEKPTFKNLALAIAVLALIAGSGAYATVYAQHQSTIESPPSVSYLLSSKSPLLNITANGVSTFGLREELGLEMGIRIPKVYSMYVKTGNALFKCYIELSSQRTLFHPWPVCLYYQKAEITWSYAEPVNTSFGQAIVNYLVVKQSGGYRLLAYTIIPLKADYGGVTAPLYEKITLVSGWGTSISGVVSKYNSKAKQILSKYLEGVSKLVYKSSMHRESIGYKLVNYLLASSLATVILYLAYRFSRRRIK